MTGEFGRHNLGDENMSSETDKERTKKQVKIDVDNHPDHVAPGTYVVSPFKELIKVPADKDLDEVIDGTLTPLDDNAYVTIQGGEVFFSHVRRGGSS